METVRLFNAVLVPDTDRDGEDVTTLTAPKGFVISPKVTAHYQPQELIKKIQKNVGISGHQANASFHKSWEKVASASMEQLVLEQITHYFTTYGFESMGVYDPASVYIPRENLEVPGLDLDGLSLTVIRPITMEQLKQRVLEMLTSGIALGEQTLKDLVSLAVECGFTPDDIAQVKNREAQCQLYDFTDTVPSDSIEFLRFWVYKSTGETLLIKNKDLIGKIKASQPLIAMATLMKYESSNKLSKLARIFHRYKPIFLAFRLNRSLKTTINKIRKLANTHHRPFKADILNITTELIKRGGLPAGEFGKALADANPFRKIRLAYSLLFQMSECCSVVYRVRNGKAWAKDYAPHKTPLWGRTLGTVLNSLSADLSKNVRGKAIYLPEHIHYALPATEKQFTGHFPTGTCVEVPSDAMVGVHWENVSNHRVDLDLAAISTNGKVGWDRRHRSDARDILFSGDVTDGAGGATELIYVKKNGVNTSLVSLNYFNYDSDKPVPFKLFVASEKAKELTQNYTVDPNNILLTAPCEISNRQQFLGILKTNAEVSQFYLGVMNIGNGITSRETPVAANSRNYLEATLTNPLSFKDLLIGSGCKIAETKEAADIDLSPEALTKDTFLSLLKA